jgi:hypothetical protein
MAMQKSLIFLSIIAGVLLSAAALSQSQCTPQFSISSPESVEMTEGLVWVQIQVTNTGSCEGSATVYLSKPEGWYYGENFTTATLQPGESENSSMKIFTSNPNSATVQFLAEGAATSETKIIIGGIVPEGSPAQPAPAAPAPEEKKEAPVIAPAPSPAPITVPQETEPVAQPAQQANEAPAQSQTETAPTTGLLTSNPSAQIAVFALLFFGAGYLVATIRGEGFRYRFKRK